MPPLSSMTLRSTYQIAVAPSMTLVPDAGQVIANRTPGSSGLRTLAWSIVSRTFDALCPHQGSRKSLRCALESRGCWPMSNAGRMADVHVGAMEIIVGRRCAERLRRYGP